MKKPVSTVFGVLFLVFSLAGCASTEVEERPLWADAYTVGQVFPSEKYVTGIGRASTQDVAVSLADGNIASFFSREISSHTSAQQIVSSENGIKPQEELIRNISVKSEVALSGVSHTELWFSKSEKLFYCCAYLDRQKAWQNYESTVAQEKEKFYSFLTAAEKETDPLKKIAILQNAKIEGEEYQKVILFSELLYKNGCAKYSADRNVIASLEEKIIKIAMNINMNVTFAKNNSNSARNVKSLIENIITDKEYKVSSSNVHYDVIITLDDGKERKDDVIIAIPEISIEIKSKTSTVLTFSRTLPRQTVFAEAEKLLDSKISKALEKILEEEFAPAFSKL